MDVYILRHGKAEDTGPGMTDADRRLTKKGREEIAAAGRWMAAQGLRFDLIAASPLARAQETAAIVAGCLEGKERLVTWDILAPGGTPDKVCHEIGKLADPGAVLLVGHEPLLSALISRIIAGNEDAAIAMTKGALAKIRDFSMTTRPSGQLHWLVTAKQMACAK
ncbi:MULTISPECIES: phosphohistidine phosphatase SixA [unclassified Methanoregula]|uniref:phosphohistidine phosphatase SixA n=1 Tax=unclassified Methanoregula TaxID=2649730 RepID=UPI0009D13237|nr:MULTISPECIES: phosphohistidine phosphatase SixA [unclassified Methanoregula]OPX63662.1 MAG: phosphohistidine phosphatase [Methanoregula sp. PtaB.Bin085]OPY36171.1 MAG: phosphohistidine phosphatase [Methanoregula sp. PtaU1.Bin006]